MYDGTKNKICGEEGTSKEGAKRRTTVEAKENSHQPIKKLYLLPVLNATTDDLSASEYLSVKISICPRCIIRSIMP